MPSLMFSSSGSALGTRDAAQPFAYYSNLLCFNSLCNYQKQKQHFRSLPRFSREICCCLKKYQTQRGPIQDATRCDLENREASTVIYHKMGDCNNLKSSPQKDVVNHINADSLLSFPSFGGLLKLLMLFGILAFRDSQPALAALDTASVLKSIPYLQDLGDISTGFTSAFLLIFFSELGDKTFFIAALLAARNSAGIVFLGTFGALAAMTIVSVLLGRTFHYIDEILPFRFGETDLPIDDIAAVLLLVYFGGSTLLNAASDDLDAGDEQKEAELAVAEFQGNGAGSLSVASTIISTFAIVFIAEWGDKSFFSTIALAAASSPLGVIGGTLAGHGVATLLAVLGGSILGTFLSDKATAYVQGILFLIFAAQTLIQIVS